MYDDDEDLVLTVRVLSKAQGALLDEWLTTAAALDNLLDFIDATHDPRLIHVLVIDGWPPDLRNERDLRREAS